MTRPRKIFVGTLWGLAAAMLLVIVGLWFATRSARTTGMAHEEALSGSSEHFAPKVAIPQYSFTDQDGKAFTTGSMKGAVWIADFIFTRCEGPCPMMTSRMAGLQKELKGKPVRFVSFSVDPEYDTPAVLKTYAADHGADLSNWSFVTGAQQDVFSLARSLLIGVSAASGKMPIAHSVKFVLIDASGNVQGYYNGDDPAEIKNLARDAGALAGL